MAGAVTSNITPPLGLGIVGDWDSPLATHIHDELHVRCQALDDGATRLASAVLDIVGVPRDVFDEAKWLTDDATESRVENLMMSATHTHRAVSARGASPLEVGTTLERETSRKIVRKRLAMFGQLK